MTVFADIGNEVVIVDRVLHRPRIGAVTEGSRSLFAQSTVGDGLQAYPER
jgi:hypothetical protein